MILQHACYLPRINNFFKRDPFPSQSCKLSEMHLHNMRSCQQFVDSQSTGVKEQLTKHVIIARTNTWNMAVKDFSCPRQLVIFTTTKKLLAALRHMAAVTSRHVTVMTSWNAAGRSLGNKWTLKKPRPKNAIYDVCTDTGHFTPNYVASTVRIQSCWTAACRLTQIQHAHSGSHLPTSGGIILTHALIRTTTTHSATLYYRVSRRNTLTVVDRRTSCL